MNQIAVYAKAITGAIVAGCTSLIAAFGPDSTPGKITSVVLAVVVASGAVWAVPNKHLEPKNPRARRAVVTSEPPATDPPAGTP